MIANFRLKSFIVASMLVMVAMTMCAEDVVFMTNRRQWEKLPTTKVMDMAIDYTNVKNMPDSAMLCFSIVANRYNENLKSEDLKLTIRATCYVGFLYFKKYHNHQESYRYLLKAKDLAEKHKYNDFMPDILMHLGNLFNAQEGLQHDKSIKEALAYHKAAFWKSVETKSYKMLPSIILNMTYVAYCSKELPQIQKEMDAYSTLEIPDTIVSDSLARTICRAIRLSMQGNPEQALKIIESAPLDDTSVHDKSTARITQYVYIYYLQLQMGKDAEALKTLYEIEKYVNQTQPELISGGYLMLSQYYHKHNNPVLADKYELMWLRTTDSISKQTGANELSTIHFLHEVEKMNEEQKALAIKQHHDRQLLWIVGGFLALATVLLILLAIGYRRIKRKNLTLYENNLALLAAEEQRRKLAEEQNQLHIQAEADKYGASKLDEQTTEELWQNIVHVMEYSQEIYDTSFCLTRLAELVGTKPNYVSQAINQQGEWSFPTLLSHYRINEACRRINDISNYGNYTVEGIGQSVGFKSRSHFVKTFKKQTGLSPSDYQKLAHSKSEA